jgi:hypothetical protein
VICYNVLHCSEKAAPALVLECDGFALTASLCPFCGGIVPLREMDRFSNGVCFVWGEFAAIAQKLNLTLTGIAHGSSICCSFSFSLERNSLF